MKHLKQEFDKLTFKEAIVYTMAVMSLITGFVLLFIGLYTAPKGEIHESVLTAFGIILVFVGSMLGISMHYANELTRLKGAIPGLIRELVPGTVRYDGDAKPAYINSPAPDLPRKESTAGNSGFWEHGFDGSGRGVNNACRDPAPEDTDDQPKP